MNHTVVDSTIQVQTEIPTAEEAVEERLQEHSQGLPGQGTDIDKIKEVISNVVSGTLFESGLLQKFVTRSVEQKLEAEGQNVAGQIEQVLREKGADLLKSALSENLNNMREELKALVERECAAALAGENLKILIDDKFRAISIYLKTDVIPKTVGQMLKLAKKPGGA